ncbi:hypothetical protein AB4Y87_23435 [Paenarthrobacter sp. RAF54_2]|uniref:hypothetical protein n=1 Tax=Paenarthrobacter sp. RAF54_2 TaxID=3233061 RepID=UPI003F97E9FF
MNSATNFRAAIGEVAQQSAQLEAVVAIVTWGLAGVEQAIARIVVPNNMDRMLSLINELVPVRVQDPELQRRVKDWSGRVRTVYNSRGRILHSVWIGNDDDGQYWRADLKPLGKPVETQTSDDLLAIANQMLDLSTVEASFIGDLVRSVSGPWPAGPTESRPAPGA